MDRIGRWFLAVFLLTILVVFAVVAVRAVSRGPSEEQRALSRAVTGSVVEAERNCLGGGDKPQQCDSETTSLTVEYDSGGHRWRATEVLTAETGVAPGDPIGLCVDPDHPARVAVPDVPGRCDGNLGQLRPGTASPID